MRGLRVITGAQTGSAARHLEEKDFDTLAYRRRHWASDTYEQRYHVFKTETESVTVTANSAKEAIQVAGFDDPFKVVRGQASSVRPGLLVKKGRLIDEEVAPDVDTEAAPETVPEEASKTANADPDPDPESVAEPTPESASGAG